MGRCETCRHWASYELDGTMAPDWNCCALAMAHDGEPESATLAYALDMERYAAELRTHRTFGCVQHEAREG